MKRCTVEPHPTTLGAYVVNDPRMCGQVVLKFSSRQRAEAFTGTRNRWRARKAARCSS